MYTSMSCRRLHDDVVQRSVIGRCCIRCRAVWQLEAPLTERLSTRLHRDALNATTLGEQEGLLHYKDAMRSRALAGE
jgi:hypothetical protein